MKGEHMAYATKFTRDEALELLKNYNKDEFHLRHALIVEGVMRYFARELGYADEEDFWGIVGLLHDIDFEEWPDEHCVKAPELLREAGAEDELIRAVTSHGWEIGPAAHDFPKPEHEMEKALYATDELTGLIGAVALMRPSRSVQDLEWKSVKKKYKSPNFAAGCSREVIAQGAELLGWELEDLVTRTILAMREVEPTLD
jgi:predicted hydrolase (HD superfamily)